MAEVTLAAAARLLGRPERTVRRWAQQGKLPARRSADGWLVDVELAELGQLAAGDRLANGQVAAQSAASGGQLAVVPLAHLVQLEARAEASAFLAGRLTVLQERLAVLEAQLRALPAPADGLDEATSGPAATAIALAEEPTDAPGGLAEASSVAVASSSRPGPRRGLWGHLVALLSG